MDLDGRNYIRNTFLALAHLNKPFIIKGTYFAHPYQDYITYKNIRPYTSRTAKTNQICDHINVMEEDVKKYLSIDPKANGRTDILVCRAKEYQGKDGSWRGGIFLTEELGIPPPRDMRRIDMNTWLKIAVPQIELRKILEKQPSLKKEVLQAFLNKS